MLTVLIIGCGNIAGGYDLNTQSEYALTHAAALNKSNQVTLAACVDNNRQAAETFAEQWAVNNSYRKLEEIPKESQFDIVCICSPSHCHETHIQQVIHFRPKVIFTEKTHYDFAVVFRQYSAAMRVPQYSSAGEL
ncbi:Gfo/Idh/MocA family oxidoreductase [Bacterioplanoides sp.]|uniref:Gfo/Idh/MocA family oxidoreductase n=1 Tax=Bacterioplanoides sp. TaxID=2066072 RepID=UPI003AFFD676